MTRLLLFLVHNWPLKLAALLLSSILYGVIVLTQDSQQVAVTVPIEARNLDDEVVLVSNLGNVQEIRYLAPDDVPANSSSFRAIIDFSGVPARADSVVLGVEVQPIDNRIRVLSWEPRQINVTVDRVTTREVPVTPVREGEVPAGLDVRAPELEFDLALVRGPSSAVARVARVEASYQVEPNGLDIDRIIDLVPVDAQGERVQQVDVEPAATRIRVVVLEDGQTKSVPVAPVVIGDPAPGFEVASVEVQPLVVTIEGDGEQLVSVTRADTEPVSVAGAAASFERDVPVSLPDGVLIVGDDDVRVSVVLRPVTSTRTFEAGVALDGARSDLRYVLSTGSVLATIGGASADLARLEGRAFTVQAAVADLEPGRHEVPLVADLPVGLTLVSTSPRTVTVTVSEASPATGPSPAPSP